MAPTPVPPSKRRSDWSPRVPALDVLEGVNRLGRSASASLPIGSWDNDGGHEAARRSVSPARAKKKKTKNSGGRGEKGQMRLEPFPVSKVFVPIELGSLENWDILGPREFPKPDSSGVR